MTRPFSRRSRTMCQLGFSQIKKDCMRVASSGHQIVDALDFSVNKVDAVCTSTYVFGWGYGRRCLAAGRDA
jgi:hypothetical protein